MMTKDPMVQLPAGWGRDNEKLHVMAWRELLRRGPSAVQALAEHAARRAGRACLYEGGGDHGRVASQGTPRVQAGQQPPMLLVVPGQLGPQGRSLVIRCCHRPSSGVLARMAQPAPPLGQSRKIVARNWRLCSP